MVPLRVDFEGPSLGGFERGVAVGVDLAASSLVDESLDVDDDDGFLPGFVGVDGRLAVLPAAGEGAMASWSVSFDLDVLAV